MSMAQSFVQLQVLKISKCNNLKHIISTYEDEDENEEIQSVGNEVNRAWFPQLKQLEVTGCEMIKAFASNDLITGSHYDRHAFPCSEELEDWDRRDLCLLNEVVRSLVRLTKMQVVGCRKLTSLFSVSVAQSMVHLKVLKVSRCNELKQIIFADQDEGKEIESTSHETRVVCFPQLEELEVTECEMISSFLFPACVALGLAQLQELKVSKLPRLKHVFGDETDRHGKDFWLPLLTKLKLEELPNLISLWQGDSISSPPSSKDWDSLFLQSKRMQVLEVSGCPNFSLYFVANRQSELQAQAEKQLSSIGLNNLQGGEFMMQLQRDGENHQLMSFYLLGICLRDVPIEHIWIGSQQHISMCFSCLKCIIVTDCNTLKQVFTTTIIKSLAQLECLTIMRCNELEHVTMEDVEHGDEDGHLKSLRILKVIQCEKLKTIFSLSVTRHHLPNLKELELKSNPELRNVFDDEMLDAKSQGILMDTNALHIPPSTLEVLVVSGCPQISSQILSQLNNQLQTPAKLSTISLEKIEKVEEVIQLQRKDVDKPLTLDLSWLNLDHLQDLKRVWKGPAINVYFSNLESVVVKHCDGLKQLFTTTIAESMVELKFLTIEQCSKLENVVIDDQDDNVVDQDDNVVNNNIIVLFPELKWLRLKDLPKLISLCPSPTYQLKSNLQKHWLKVEGCPQNIEVSFSTYQKRSIL